MKFNEDEELALKLGKEIYWAACYEFEKEFDFDFNERARADFLDRAWNILDIVDKHINGEECFQCNGRGWVSEEDFGIEVDHPLGGETELCCQCGGEGKIKNEPI